MCRIFFPARYFQEYVPISMCRLAGMNIGTFAHILSKKNWNLTNRRPRYRLRHSKKTGFGVILGLSQIDPKWPKIRVFWNVWACILDVYRSNFNFFCSKYARRSQFSYLLAYTSILERTLGNIGREKKKVYHFGTKPGDLNWLAWYIYITWWGISAFNLDNKGGIGQKRVKKRPKKFTICLFCVHLPM